MVGSPIRRIALLALILLPLGCRRPAASSAGPSGPPARIVSLTPNTTEILLALGAAERLVGVSRFCPEPVPGREVARVGGILDPSAERIVALHPDLVVGHWDGAEAPVVARVRAAGVEVLRCRIVSLGDLRACIERIGDRVGAPGAAADLVAKMAPVLSPRPAPPGAPRVLLLLNESPLIVASGRSFPAEVARIAGLDPLPGPDGPGYPRLSMERLGELKPVLLVDVVHGAARDPVFEARLSATLPGVRRVRVDPDGLVRPGPRLLEGLEALRALAGAP